MELAEEGVECYDGRSLRHNDVLINLFFFCRAVGVGIPEDTSRPIEFIREYTTKHGLSMDEIAEKVAEYRRVYRIKRRTNQKRRIVMDKAEEIAFFKEHGRPEAKQRSCLRCAKGFLSRSGNRVCDKCNYLINNYLTVGTMD